ncbi:MAG: histidine phosphatase family protein [Candidatus Diapherotrites archaeon]|nr:histidine phosphatase family protein [Candidatus Diapherotrites archaeon]
MAFKRLRVKVRRHAQRPTNQGIGIFTSLLTSSGEKKSRALAKHLRIHGIQPKVYTTELKRNIRTGQLIRRGTQSPYPQRTRSWGKYFIKPTAPKKELEEVFKGEAHDIIKKWLKGEVSERVLYSPHECAINTLHLLRFFPRATQRAQKYSYKGPTHAEFIAHDVTIAALLHELTGQVPVPKPEKEYVRPLEALQFTFTPNQITLRFRGKNYNVTQKFNELVQEARAFKKSKPA